MEESKYAVIANNINKCYKMYSSQKEKLLDLISNKGAGKTFYALRDISFKVEKGEVVGLLGLNGAGKSTLSNILGGVSLPNSGEIIINGESSLIAIGLGLNNFLTGLENIELKALMMGYKKDEIERIKQEVIEFAEIGDFINQPIRTYSSGMRSRLGFGISIHMNPDIIVIDEALSVGDPTFAQKCLDKMNEFKASGKTIFFVSHSLPQVKQFCTKAMWLEYGTLREYGDIDEVLPKYQNYINTINKMTAEEKADYKKSVLKNQEHSLLEEFRVIDPELKKVIPNGKILKYASVVNKDLKIKNIPYNFDFYTFAFGCLPSLFRKKYDTMILILMSQILNFLVIPFPFSIISNFIITLIYALFSGKLYVNNLIENNGYIPYHIWKKNADLMKLPDKDIRKVNKKLKKVKRKNRLLLLLSIVTTSAFISFAVFIQYRPKIEETVAYMSDNMIIKDFAIINIETKNDKEYLRDITFINTDSINGDMQGTIYPGNLQVLGEEGYDELNNLIKDYDIDEVKRVVEKGLGKNINGFIFLKNEEKYEGDLKDIYTESIMKFLDMNDEELDLGIDELCSNNSSIQKTDVERFYNEFKEKKSKIKFNLIKYQEVPITDIIKKEILLDINRKDLLEYKFLMLDKREINNSVLIKEINDEYKRKLEKDKELEEQEAEEEESVNNNSGNNNNSSNNNGNNNNTNNSGSNSNNGSGNNSGNTSKPPVVNPDPPVVEPDPPVVNPDPPVVEPEPPAVEPDPPVENPDSPIVEQD